MGPNKQGGFRGAIGNLQIIMQSVNELAIPRRHAVSVKPYLCGIKDQIKARNKARRR